MKLKNEQKKVDLHLLNNNWSTQPKLMNVKFILTSFLISLPWLVKAESLDFLRSTGKIYSVVVVILILFILISAYLIRLDRKIRTLEEKNNNES